MKKNLLLITALFVFVGLSAQKTTNFTIPKKATANISEIKEDFKTSLMCVEQPLPGGMSPNKPPVNWSNTKNMNDLSVAAGTLSPIFLGRNFVGNTFNNSTPNDNDIAISNNCRIVSVSNTMIYFHNCNTNLGEGSISLSAFALPLGTYNQAFDPKVAYDPVSDRFAIVYLNGFTPTTSSIIVAFSQTNDPKGTWNYYALPGNPFNNNLWTDYPMITFSKDELFITVNLLVPGGSWQTSFAEAIIWQIKKSDGYAGLPLTTQLHNDIKFNGEYRRNICPVKGGSTLHGPNQYFLNNKNFSAGTDSLFLIEITDTIAAAGQTLTVTKLHTSPDYSMAPDARQPAPHTFATNDSRVLGAFIENNKIQYVHNTLVPGTGFCGVYHGVINSVSTTPTVIGHIISDAVMDFGYPNISYAGNSSTDNTCIINFNHTAPTVNAGCSAIKGNDVFDYSPVLKLRDGSSFVDILGSTQERWGDYTGSQRKYNEPDKFWVNGYDAYMTGGVRYHRTYIAEIGLNFIVTDVKNNVAAAELDQVKTYPNPAKDFVNFSFELNAADNLDFILYDVSGKQVKILLKEYVKVGKHQLSFSMESLSSGIYFLKVFSANRQYADQKIVKE